MESLLHHRPFNFADLSWGVVVEQNFNVPDEKRYQKYYVNISAIMKKLF